MFVRVASGDLFAECHIYFLAGVERHYPRPVESYKLPGQTVATVTCLYGKTTLVDA